MATSWSAVGNTLLIGRYSSYAKHLDSSPNSDTAAKVAAFDLDSTLISTKSGKLHAKDEYDWEWWHESVPTKLGDLYKDGYQIIIFTNQGRLTDENGRSAPETEMFKLKVEALFEALDVPLTLYAACANDNYRKPRTAMWEKMKEDYREIIHSFRLELSFLVGDAAGREKDHSDADRHFCINVGIPFFTPEEFFLQALPEPKTDKFDPAWYLPPNDTAIYTPIDLKPGHQSLLVLVGPPGAGKSTYYRRILQPLGYDHVNQDSLGSHESCVMVAERLLEEGNSVVIDNSNTKIADRRIWISLASKHNIRVRALHFTTPVDLCLHNDTVRALGGDQMNPERRIIFPRIPFRKLISQFEEPKKSEGFEEVIKVDFEWIGNAEELQIWNKHWI
ncbi:putative DNA 3'-phosphatase Tpp1 [Lepidopterella palustris CBS 459.81]|uniref:Putative DNA 3'-phosphatase Tpp1 n=1 Tax=Lepidopterella palustris CBS 459.81 TaxID=1314670 RepID=A0A8E2J9Y9_9PEZI|nr:putative DNA 3'-phosphatase Tpp1 [Lepidopterella palustris CBS 459.81]